MNTHHLEHKRRTLRLLITSQLKVLASLQTQLRLSLALCTLQSQHDLLRRLGFLVEHGLRLTSVTGLFAVVTALSLGEEGGLVCALESCFILFKRMDVGVGYLAGFVLGDFVLSVLFAGFALAVGAAGLGDVDLGNELVV
jgi:hypothetical protein